MGALLCSPAEKDEKQPDSIIHLSDDCLSRLTKQEEERKAAGKQNAAEILNLPEDLEEKHWIMTLKCLDDSHSNEYGITIQNVYKLMEKIEDTMGDLRTVVCSPDEVIQCLKKNANCSIKCKRLMDEYIDCIDTARINIMKERLQNEQKEKRKEEQTVVEQFLKNEYK